MNQSEKIKSIEGNGNDRKIVVTHITVRQSIFILLLKLIAIEILAAGSLTSIQLLFFTYGTRIMAIDSYMAIFIPLLFTAIFIKTAIMIFVIFQWLNEYYEITPSEVIHKNGLIFKKEERYAVKHLGSLEIDQGIFGKLFSFGTINTYNWALEKYFSLYLIHNVNKYYAILETLIPDADKEKHIIREYIIEPDVTEVTV